MAICRSCGSSNRDSARFCLQCAEPLGAGYSDDQAWLAATLTTTPASPSVVAPPMPDIDPPEAPDPPEHKDEMMTTPIPADSNPSEPPIAGRYEVVTRIGDAVEVIDRQPWQRCWSCDTTENEAGELFCTQCGANLDARRYHGQLIEGEPTGLALVTTVADTKARELLPPIWDQVGEQEKTLTLLVDTGRPALTPPLDELDALFVGRGLAQLLSALHTVGLRLGEIAPDDVELTPARAPRLRDTPALHTADEKESVAGDLAALANLLAQLTQTPRTTQRLDEDAVPEAPLLPDLLRAVRTSTIADAATLASRFDELIIDRTEPTSLRMRIGAATHNGMVRELDEDSLLALDLTMMRSAQPRTWGLFIVADGMGGHSAGEVASDLALRGAYEVVQSAYLSPTVDTDVQNDDAQLKDIVKRAIQQANEYVVREARSRGNDMGTTITMALVVGDRAIIGNIGDSRTYLMRDGVLRRVSKDHSLVQRLVDLGQIKADDVYTHPQRNAVLRSLGDKSEIEIDIFSERLRPGDALVLMSDGQWEMTHDPQMTDIIMSIDDPQAACRVLIDAANAAGGDDNITTILVRFENWETPRSEHA